MRTVPIEPTFESWQAAARALVRARVPPSEVVWDDGAAITAPLPGLEGVSEPAPWPAPTVSAPSQIRVPRRFVEVARLVAGHRDPGRWDALYAVLWRLVHENAQLLTSPGDPEVARLFQMEREVRRSAGIDRDATRTSPGTTDVPQKEELSRPSPGAGPFVPPGGDLPALRQAAAGCTGCELHRQATQTVFGQGPATARVVLVGEQPGDQEDLKGAPFVGPAGDVLDRALAEAGLPRAEVYVTNAVKHFKFVYRGKRRIHEKPRSAEVQACRPWLEAELGVLKPAIVVCLGATAAQALLGAQFRLMKERGRFLESRWAPRLLATLHPSAVLRGEDPEHQAELYALLVEDLRAVAAALAAPPLADSSRTDEVSRP